jgi:putative protease
MRVPEILAPAGDDESLDAALAAGADAVYFGLDEGLNARARATNFSAARLPDLCDHVHRAGARAYVTLNTLVFEHELPAVEAVLRACAAAGVDAVIVQDPAVALLARAVSPTLEVHASTQMTISSPEGAAFAAQLGATRVVVPRELSVDDVRTFAQGTPLELEVFIHGALCVSWSGQCLTSEAWGGRSANRGQCAQSCRLPYRLVVDGEVRELGEVAYLLSPLDLAGVRAVPALVDLGVASLKIEGRLKGPAYVSTAVETYRAWRDAVVERNEAAARPQLAQDLGRMAVAYSRGFSDGFLGGANHQDLVEGRFPKHRGALLGEVVEVKGQSVRVRRASRQPSGGAATREGYRPEGVPSVSLPELGDAVVPEPIPGAGVGFDLGRPQEDEPGGPIFGVDPAAGGWWLRFGRPGPDLSQVGPGTLVWLSSTPSLTAHAQAAVAAGRRGPGGRIPVVLQVRGQVGQPLEATFAAGGPVGGGQLVRGTTTDTLSLSTGDGLGVAVLADKLGAMGGTPFALASVDLTGLGAGLHVPVSALKALRRTLISSLEQHVLDARRHATAEGPAAPRVVAAAKALQARRAFHAPSLPTLVPLVRRAEQLEAVIAAGLKTVELDWMELVGLEQAVTRARDAGLEVIIATTRVQKPGEAGVDARLERLAPDGMLVRHWGALVHFSRKESALAVHGDFSLNVTNSVTAHHLLALGADTLSAAHDLDETQLFALLANAPPERFTVAVHHHISTFHTEHCVYAHTLSHGRDFKTCGRPCESHQLALEDPKGLRHPVVVDVGCRNTVFNAQAQSAAAVVPRLLAAGVRRFRVEFVWEDQRACAAVLEAWTELLQGRSTPAQLTTRLRTQEQFGVTAGTMRTLGG